MKPNRKWPGSPASNTLPHGRPLSQGPGDSHQQADEAETKERRYRIEVLSAPSGDDRAVTSRLARLVNETYRRTERNLLPDDFDRTTPAQVSKLIRENCIAVAWEGQRIVGCVHSNPLGPDTAAFDMLATALDHPERDVERALVNFTERHIRSSGRTAAQTQLLVPRFRPDPAKTRLAAWYDELGYARSRREAVEDIYPDVAAALMNASDVVTYRKYLVPSTQ
ncbi:hypothetical protein V1L54_02295 [Streptomyces sp. TRM 70361]|uniref:hypothetical protein n=1 Tax=Streptomyces sp. TRM 70361 TaxID=3116553 RepID=UPI002E7AE262|nr:hypothetical protein [Streptomyces sp. TRM 70361]MEE1938257.1 hypothetical protein [Streptomyces sp. TRM 70361]